MCQDGKVNALVHYHLESHSEGITFLFYAVFVKSLSQVSAFVLGMVSFMSISCGSMLLLAAVPTIGLIAVKVFYPFLLVAYMRSTRLLKYMTQLQHI